MDLRERIIAAAAELVKGRTLEDLKITALAENLGVSRQTIYRHVGGIEQIKKQLESIPEIETRSVDTRGKILTSAYRVFSNLGFTGASIDQIAEDAGLTKGAVYWHFSNKNDLFLALFDLRMSKLNAVMPDASHIVVNAANPQETFAQLLEAQLAFALADPHWPRLYLEFLAQSREPAIWHRLSAALLAIQQQTAELIRQLQGVGLVSKQVRAESMANLIITILDGIVLNRLCNPKPEPIHILAKEIANMLYNGVSNEGSNYVC